MKQYENPIIELILLLKDDVITTSDQGTETTPIPDGDGVWDLDLG